MPTITIYKTGYMTCDGKYHCGGRPKNCHLVDVISHFHCCQCPSFLVEKGFLCVIDNRSNSISLREGIEEKIKQKEVFL